MDTILQIFQTYSHFFLTGATMLILWASWRVYLIFITQRGKNLDILRIKKIAGNATIDELEYLNKTKVPFLYRRRYKKLSMLGQKHQTLKDWYNDFTFKEFFTGLNQYNPFVIKRQMEIMRKEYNELERDVYRFKSSTSRDMAKFISTIILKPEPTGKVKPKESTVKKVKKENQTKFSDLNINPNPKNVSSFE